MRSVRRQVDEERFLAGALRVDPLQCLAKEDIGAEAGGFLELTVMQDGGVEVGVARGIAAAAGIGLADTAGAVDEDLIEAASVGLVGGLVAEVPFTEDAGRVAR